MKKTKLVSLLLAGVMTLGTASFALTLGGSIATTANAASGVNMWFDHVSVKTVQSDNSSTGMSSYHMYMAKNEIEGCQFLVSPSETVKIDAKVTDFVNEAGDVLETELFYEHYFTLKDYKTKMPDAIPPMTEPIEVKAGNSQGFYFKIATTPDTKAGDYTATVTVLVDGEEVNRGEVTLTVWDFTLSEETPLDTAIDIGKFGIYSSHNMPEGDDGELYRNYYDFMLENRIASYTLPYDILSDEVNEYLNNPRVTAFMIGGDYNGQNTDPEVIKAIYEKLSKNPEWFDKGYFYYVDEPTEMGKLNLLKAAGEKLETLYPGYQMISPFFFNIDVGGGKDQFAFMSDYLKIWCTKVNAWTDPYATGEGVVHMMNQSQVALYGDYASRVAAEVEGGDKNWVYYCWEPVAPYTTFDASHDPIEQRVAMWQAMDNDVTGLLYFTATEWTAQMWRYLDKINAGGQVVYGDGILIYPGYKYGVHGPISSMRLESVRDGIEDYMYLDMAKSLLTESTYDEIMDVITVDVLNWCNDSDVFYNTRVALGSMLESALVNGDTVSETIEFKASSGFTTGGTSYVGGAGVDTPVMSVLAATKNMNGVEVVRGETVLGLKDTVKVGDVLRQVKADGTVGQELSVIIKGNVNGDDKINLADVSAMLQKIAGWDVDADVVAGDVDANGKVNLADVSAVLKKIAGWDITFNMTPVLAEK